MKNPSQSIAAVFLALMVPSTAGAHEFWLAPSNYAPSLAETITVRALAGEGFRGELKPWSNPHGVRFVGSTLREFDLTRGASSGDSVWLRFHPVDQGGAMLAFESSFTPIELPADRFDAYLKDDGLDAVIRVRAGLPKDTPGRERYRRCAKTWISGSDSARALRSMGLPLEIVPRQIPGKRALLDLLVLREGKPLAGALVNAWRAPLGNGSLPVDLAVRGKVPIAWHGRTDAWGRITVPTRESGEWLVSLVDMVPCSEKAEADWESTWASLTFARR